MTNPTSPRIENLLNSLAQRHVPARATRPSDGNRIVVLAGALAANGVLVIPLTVPAAHQPQQNALISEMVSLYGSLYRLLTDVLFPSLKAITANYADAENPPILLFEAAGLPVTAAFANYVVPFIAAGNTAQVISVPELQGIMHFMLEDLEAQDIAPAVQRDIVQRGSDYITRLMNLPIRPQSLTPFLRKKYVYLAPEPPELPIAATPPPPPEAPRPTQSAPPPPPEALRQPEPIAPSRFQSSIPIFFDLNERNDDNDRMPPVLPPPKR